jgi:hypothetical protein
MKFSFFTTVVLVLATSIPLAAADKGAKKGKGQKAIPGFEGQPYMVRNLERLTKAKTAIQGGKGEAEAMELLRQVSGAMSKATDKGNYVVDMRRFAGMAFSHLEKGETERALADIDSAIKAVNRAGQVGEK